LPLRASLRSCLAGSALLSLSLAPGLARATPAGAPESRTGSYSPYEQETIRLVSHQRGLDLDPEPEGKTIEAIDVVALEVFEPRDPAPRILNRLHVTSRDHVIRREVLLQEGEPFRKVLVDETARNLRKFSQISVVLCIAVRGSSTDRVRLVVITKDVWSLRLNWDVALSAGGIERLVLAPTEANVLGLQHSTGARLDLLPESAGVGLRYAIPRLLGTRVATALEAGFLFNRRSLKNEGNFGSFLVERPLFSTLTPWALRFSTSFRDELQRRYVNAALSQFARREAPEAAIPFLYRSNRSTTTASATRSFGWAMKHDLTAGVELLIREFSIPDAERYDPATVEVFRRTRVPTSDNRLSPFVQWRSYTTHFLRTLDLETLGLQEDVRLGHDLGLRLYPSWSGLLSTRTLVGVSQSAGYTVALSDGYARLGVASTTEHELLGQGRQRVADGAVSIDGRVVTPRLRWGRLLVDGSLLSRYRNYLNRTTFLGGDSRLRGWPSSYLVGQNLVVYNVELRSRPMQLFSCQLGASVFYDVGDAPAALSRLDPRQSVGVGFRALFPQLDRVVFRGDLGFPLQKGGLPPGVQPVSFFLAFQQAFGAD
jgi:hypothetical protein